MPSIPGAEEVISSQLNAYNRKDIDEFMRGGQMTATILRFRMTLCAWGKQTSASGTSSASWSRTCTVNSCRAW